ncbi:MAG: stage V sporulation protein AE [Ruminiclostridium sp.]
MDFLWAFLIGGAICAVGQLLIDLTKLTPARILVIYVVAGVIIGALGWYEPLVRFAGAGATIPLTGFGYTLAKGVYMAVTENGLMGAFTGGLMAGAGGITASVVMGLLVALLFKRGDKTAKAL